jgi:hypothetical protein
MLEKHCLQDESLSWAAKGLHTYLMSLPDDWKVNITDLKNRSKDGRDATTTAMQALMTAGYVVRRREHDTSGHFSGYNYFVFETKDQAKAWVEVNTVSGFSVNGLSVNGFTVNGKSVTTNNTINQEYNILRKEEEETRESELQTIEEEKTPFPQVAPDPLSPFAAFDLDTAAAALASDPLCRDRYGREVERTPEQATTEHPNAVAMFTEDQKAVCTIYHNNRQFRAHYFAWLAKRKEAKQRQPANNVRQTTQTSTTYKRLAQ